MTDAADQIAGILPTVVIGGVAVKMTEAMFGDKDDSKVAFKKKKKKTDKNAYEREREEFGEKNGNSPF